MKGQAQEGLINVIRYLQGGCKEEVASFFPVMPSARTRGHGHTLIHIRKYFFPVMVITGWHRLPREAVESPSLEVFKSSQDFLNSQY